jgi:hypothetical protein
MIVHIKYDVLFSAFASKVCAVYALSYYSGLSGLSFTTAYVMDIVYMHACMVSMSLFSDYLVSLWQKQLAFHYLRCVVIGC